MARSLHRSGCPRPPRLAHWLQTSVEPVSSRLGSDSVLQSDSSQPLAPGVLGPSAWAHGPLPTHVRVGTGTVITGEHAFKRFRAKQADALVIGANTTMDGVHFAVEAEGRIQIGDYCYFTNAVLLCELELRIGSYVVIGWNASIADSDFHPLRPAQRIADAIACSPLSHNRARPPITRRPVIIEDDVWIGPNATILKGVRIGAGAFIEPGSLVTRDVPARARVLGNPAQIIGEVS